MAPPLELPDNEIIHRLHDMPAGSVYYLSSRDVFVRGSDYHARGSVRRMEWGKKGAVLNVSVQGSRLRPYTVSISLEGNGLLHRCDCPAWSDWKNCKHVVCAVLTIKNLLNPHVFAGKDDDRRERLLGEFLSAGSFVAGKDAQKTAVGKGGSRKVLRKEPEASKHSIIIERAGYGNMASVSVFSGEKRITYPFDAPKELQSLIAGYFGGYYGGQFESDEQPGLLGYLNRHGANRHPVYLREGGGQKIPLAWESGLAFKSATELDLKGDQIKVTPLCKAHDMVCREFLRGGSGLFVDLERKKIARLADTAGWNVWENFRRVKEGSSFYDETSQYDKKSALSVPVSFLTNDSQVEMAKGDASAVLDRLLLKVKGKPAQPENRVQSYKLVVDEAGPGPKAGFVLRPRCLAGRDEYTPSWRMFAPLTIWNDDIWRLSPALRAKKRRKGIVEIFLALLAAENRKACEKLIQPALTKNDLFKGTVRTGVKRLLKDAAANLHTDSIRLLCDGDGWYLVESRREQETLLYRVPCEVFGPDIFEGTQDVAEIAVDRAALYLNLPLLQQRLAEHGIPLEFKGKAVAAESWDFSFEAKSAGIDWFELRPEIRCNGKVVDEDTWRRALEGGGVIEEGDCIRVLDPRAMGVLNAISGVYPKKAAGKGRKEVAQVPRLQILDWMELRKLGVKVKLPAEVEALLERLTRFEKIEKRPLPDGLKATLRPYQKEGYYWLSFLYENRFGGCLADDMGLGKTLQTITLLAGIKEGKVKPVVQADGPHLVVVPPSLLFNWQSELERFCPELKVRCYAGADRDPDFTGCDVVLTTYALARLDLERLRETQFNVIVFDEAQAVKNIYAATTGAVRQLKGYFKLAITGTPLENHLGEYHSIMDLALPGLLGDYDDFKGFIKGDVSPALDTILRRTRPFILRRTKEKILKELPPKTETDIYLDLTEKQKALYTRTVAMIRKDIARAYADKTAAQAQIIALTAIMRLRQLCVSPRLLEPDHKEDSPKVEFLCDKLTELMEEGHSALVFSQFTSFLDIVEEALQTRQMPFSRLDGSTAVGKRKTLVEGFQEGKDASVFLLSLKAGGQGLNLTKASYVFHLDPWWNPAVENQASDRAHRIGQTSRVTITRILMRHTVEEKMMALKEKKQALFKAILDEPQAGKKGFAVTKEDFDFLLG